MDDLETRELRYFLAVADELHFGRAAERIGIAQPPLSRAIRRLEERLGTPLFVRDRRGAALTEAGEVLQREGRIALTAVAAAARRTRRAGARAQRVVLVTKAGASHELLEAILDTHAADAGAVPIEVLLCEIGEQETHLRDGSADVALMHRPFDVLDGFATEDLHTEQQVAILPRSHALAARASVTLADVESIPGLPAARWPRRDGSYADGPGPEVHTQSQLAQLVALGRTVIVIPRSSRSWQWPEHVAVPVLDAPLATTTIAWRPETASPAVARVVANALRASTAFAAAERRSA
ncbi:LysR family transcriptional regulator [Curtobacterium sp. RRHDQ10]|uniref:LysR family transcriptional regulator n=1 Tax=Curtobacterium phyllosphaerae TaxID=3413379 RepID=UPI003BF4436F